MAHAEKFIIKAVVLAINESVKASHDVRCMIVQPTEARLLEAFGCSYWEAGTLLRLYKTAVVVFPVQRRALLVGRDARLPQETPYLAYGQEQDSRPRTGNFVHASTPSVAQ